MADIKILIQGYAQIKDNYQYASSAVTLISVNNLKILVDVGMNRHLLINSLKKENLCLKDIDFIVLTHNHLDHCLLSGLFENAQILDYGFIYRFGGEIIEHQGYIPGTDIKIINTPGHDPFHCIVLLHNNDMGQVVIAGDLFWWTDGQEQETGKEHLLKLQDPYVNNKKELYQSRKNILKIADYIIPGHGKPFIVKRK